MHHIARKLKKLPTFSVRQEEREKRARLGELEELENERIECDRISISTGLKSSPLTVRNRQMKGEGLRQTVSI